MIGQPTQLASAPKCPFCGASADGFTAASHPEARPSKGDIAICLYCNEVQVYDGEPLAIRRPTPQEAAGFAADEDIQRHRDMARSARRIGGFEQRGRLQ